MIIWNDSRGTLNQDSRILPAQSTPSPVYPDLQWHLKEPGKLEQSALDEQLLCLDELHSSTSLNKGKNIYYFYSWVRKGQYFQFISRHAQNKSFCLDISLFFNSFIHSFIYLFLSSSINRFICFILIYPIHNCRQDNRVDTNSETLACQILFDKLSCLSKDYWYKSSEK